MQITYLKVPRSCDAETTVWWVLRNLPWSYGSMARVGDEATGLFIGKNPCNSKDGKRKPKCKTA